MAKCKAKTKAGPRCKRVAIGKHGFCPTHKASGTAGNGKTGRPRRKAEAVYAREFKKLGPPNYDDPIELFIWAQKACAAAMHLTMCGKGDDRLNAQTRQFAATLGRGIPVDKIVARIVATYNKPQKPRATNDHEVIPADELSRAPGNSGSLRG